MRHELADALFSLAALSAQTNEDQELNLKYAQEHFDVRSELRDGRQINEDRMAMAHGELGHILMLSGRYHDAIDRCKDAINLTRKSPRYLAGEDWPVFSHCHQAFALSALDRNDEGLNLMRQTLNYLINHPGPPGAHVFQ